jgi:hypothetical protein
MITPGNLHFDLARMLRRSQDDTDTFKKSRVTLPDEMAEQIVKAAGWEPYRSNSDYWSRDGQNTTLSEALAVTLNALAIANAS